MAKKVGRRKGSRNKGYFFRRGRGWFTKVGQDFVPLTAENGERLRDESDEGVELAYARHLLALEAAAKVSPAQKKVPEKSATASVGEVCARYLAHLKPKEPLGPNPKGVGKTYRDRGQTLFDFCYGLPAEYFCDGDKDRRKAKGDPEPKRIHAGFGALSCPELTPADIDTWLQAHTWKPGGYRTRVQAVKRAMNFGVERKLIEANPIRGYRIPKSTSRVTYLTPEQEKGMLGIVSPAFATALRVCVRTGARFGCEFAALTSEHVRDHGDRMEWVFKAEESKTKNQRILRITDPQVIATIRAQRERYPEGALFRSQSGEPWTRAMLSQNFCRAKAKLGKQGISLDQDACMYSCRHTYAKRILEGYWSGKPASIKTLSRLMGNSVQVCMDHYLQFSDADNEMLWGNA